MYTIVICKNELYERDDTEKNFTLTDTYTQELTEAEYKECVSPDTIQYFRNLGGIENVTRQGKRVTRLVSISPGELSKHIREFKFEKRGAK